MSEAANQYLTSVEAAKILHIQLERLYRLLWMGDIVGEKVDGKWRVLRESVEERLVRLPLKSKYL